MNKKINLEEIFYILGLVNNIFLILIFLIRKDSSLLSSIAPFYFLLAIPAFSSLFLVKKQNKSVRYTIFLCIFFAFLIIEFLYDYVFKINFRESMVWYLLVPYLVLYYSMNYGFVAMTWKYYSKKKGILLLALLIIQLFINIFTH
jgi:hypothetical protein